MGKKKKEPAQSTSADPFSLPAKPVREGAAPGQEVDLVTNLYQISIKLEKPIYIYTIQIDLLNASSHGKSGESQAGAALKRPAAVARKIPRELRRQAAKRAIERWLRNNSSKLEGLDLRYELDGNASTMYAMFKMLAVYDGKAQAGIAREKLEIKSFTLAKYSEAQTKIEDKKEAVLVRIYSPSLCDTRKLIDLCAGKISRSSAEVDETLKALNIIMMPRYMEDARYLYMQHKTGISSVFPLSSKSQFDISPGFFCNKGFMTSVRPSECGPVVVVANTCSPFFHPLSLLEFISKRYNVRDFSRALSPHIIDELRREFKTKQVEATHINYGNETSRPHYKKYRVHNIGTRSTREEKFDIKDDATGQVTTMSVFDYFKKTYPKCPLKYPNLPCVLDNQRKIPLEVCRIVDKQKVSRNLDPPETSAIIREMAVKPKIHFDAIQANANDVIETNKGPLDSFGLEINPKPIEVVGRELPPIRLIAGKAQRVETRGGEYDVRFAEFALATKVNKWAIVVLSDSRSLTKNSLEEQNLRRECLNFSSLYSRAGHSKGVAIGPLANCTFVSLQDYAAGNEQQLKFYLRRGFEYFNEKHFDHVIFILPERWDWIYSYLQYLEVDVPRRRVRSQRCTRSSCIKSSNFFEKILRASNPSTFLANLWLKYNSKLGGVNITLDATQNFGFHPKPGEPAAKDPKPKDWVNFLDPNYLFVSIDVCHPAPGDRLEQSVAAAVGMWNLTSSKMSYCTRVRVQRKDKSDKEKSTVEQVGEIGVMFEEILGSYKAYNQGKVPSHIVILRDGVSEGQFQMVLRFELLQIRQVIKNFYSKMSVASPKLTCLTVQKRHKIRFRRKIPVTITSMNGLKSVDYNIHPGTVVDNKVIQPNDFSFYMAPHKAIQGTARAPYIYMIYDEIKFSQDAAQAMIFALSYLSPRCTKGTSIPTPVNLADLAAERGKNIVVSWNDDNRNRRLSPEERLRELNAFLSEMGDSNYQNTLYYV